MRFLAPLLVLLLLASVHDRGSAQCIVTFEGFHSQSNEQLLLDSVRIENLTSGLHHTLHGGNAYDLDLLTGLAGLSSPSLFTLTANYPNAFGIDTRFEVHLGRTAEVHLQLFDVLGRNVISRRISLAPGVHGFMLSAPALPSGVYFLTAASSSVNHTQKLLKLPGGGDAAPSFKYSGLRNEKGLQKNRLSDRYRFTVYTEGFSPSVLDDSSPQGGQTLRFPLTPLAEPRIAPAVLQGHTGEECSWTAHCDRLPAKARYEWSFGDGETETVVGDSSATHRYGMAGDYEPAVRIYNNRNGNFISTATATARVTMPEYRVQLQPENLEGETGTAYTWTATVIPSPEHARYSWDFGDSHLMSGANNSAEHTYVDPGEYDVVVNVTDTSTNTVIGADTVHARIVASGRITTGDTEEVLRTRVDAGGGTITVTTPDTPVTGLHIRVDADGYGESREFTISYAPVLSHGMGDDFLPLSPLITVENGGGYAENPMIICIPITLPPDHFAMVFFYDDQTGELEGLPILSLTANEICVATRHVSSDALGLGKKAARGMQGSYVQLIVTAVEKQRLSGTVMSDFRSGVDDWEFPNRGSYIAPKGHCAGQSISAMWYYSARKLALGEPALNSRFDDVHTDSMWMDNPHGYRLASVVQKDINWDTRVAWWKTFDSLGVGIYSRDSLNFLAFKYALLMTEKPQYIRVAREGGGHALVLFGADGNTLKISDPNYPGIARTISMENGSFKPYETMQRVGQPTYLYPVIQYYAKSAMVSFQAIAARWQQFEAGTIGAVAPNAFPGVELFLKHEDQLHELGTTFTTTDDTLVIVATCVACVNTYEFDRTLVIAFRENGTRITKTDARGELRLPLEDGKNRYGLALCGWPSVGAGGEYIDFAWLEVEKLATGEVEWYIHGKCSGNSGWGRFGQKRLSLAGHWVADVYSYSIDTTHEGLGIMIDFEARIDTISGVLLTYDHTTELDFGGGAVMHLHIEGRNLPAIAIDEKQYRYESTGIGTCTYIDTVVGRNLIMCGDLLEWDCADYEDQQSLVQITLPARGK